MSPLRVLTHKSGSSGKWSDSTWAHRRQLEQLLQQVTTRGTLIIIYRNGGVNGTNDTNHVGNKCREHVGSESY